MQATETKILESTVSVRSISFDVQLPVDGRGGYMVLDDIGLISLHAHLKNIVAAGGPFADGKVGITLAADTADPETLGEIMEKARRIIDIHLIR